MEETIQIIIAEDSDLWRHTIVRELRHFNIVTVFQATNGKELLDRLARMLPDVVLLDLEMPEMDGNQAFHIIRQKFPELPVIILSQHGEQGVMRNYIERGAMGFLPKQFVSGDLSILASGIRAVKHGKQFYYSLDVTGKKFKYSNREVEIIPMLTQGKTSREIGKELGLSEKTVEAYRKRIYKKTRTRNLAELIRYSIKKGLEYLGK